MNVLRSIVVLLLLACGISACGDGSADGGSVAVRVAATASQRSTEPALTMAGSGRTIAVWSTWSSATSSLWIAQYEPGSGWGVARRAGYGTGSEYGAKVAANSAGDAVLAWARQVNGSTELVAAVYRPVDGWSAAAVLDSTRIAAPVITVLMDDAGTATVFWQRAAADTNLNTTVMTARHTSSGWGAAQEVVSATSTLDQSFAGNGPGQILSIWTHADPDPADQFVHNYNSFVRLFASGAGWSGAQPIGNNVPEMNGSFYYNPTTTPGHYTPRVALDGLGNAAAFWTEAYYQGDPFHLMVNSLAAAGGWGAPQELGSISADSTLYVSPMVTDGPGTFHLCLVDCRYTFSLTVSSIYVVTHTAGSGWTITRVIDAQPVYCLHPRLSIGNNGSLHLTWLQIDENVTHLWTKRYTPAAGWGDSRRIDELDGNIETYQTAWNSSGHVMAIWSQNTGSSWATLAKPLD